MASRCRKNRPRMIDDWDRALASNSWRTEAAAEPPSTAVVWVALAKANPRVEKAVEQVGNQVEDDNNRRGDREPAHQGRGVVVADGLDQHGAHAVPAEHPLGDDRATDDGADVQREQGADRDEGVAHGVPEDHPRLGKTL